MEAENNPMHRDSFIFYRSFFEAIDEADDNSQLALYRAIVRYALNGEEPELKGMVKALWIAVKPQLDANTKRFLNGCRGGAPKGNTNARKQPKNNQKQPNVNVNENYNDNDNVNEKKERKTAMRFIPPSLDDVKKFFEENNFNSNPEEFYDYYTSNGWSVGKSKMKDWKASGRNWERREEEFSISRNGYKKEKNSFKPGELDYSDTDFGGMDYSKDYKDYKKDKYELRRGRDTTARSADDYTGTL